MKYRPETRLLPTQAGAAIATLAGMRRREYDTRVEATAAGREALRPRLQEPRAADRADARPNGGGNGR